jgi:hypothetical protein
VAGSTLKAGLTEGAEALGGEALDGFAAAGKVENYAKAVAAAKKAQVAGTSIEGAVNSATEGALPYQEFLNYGQYLRNQGLHETDMLSESLARRVASSGLAKAGLPVGKALQVAKGAETLVNAGFALQQVHGALYAYPRVMDLLAQGDYDDAAEYMVEAGAGTVFGTLGLAHSLYSVNDLIPGLNEKNNLELSDETEAIKKLFGVHDGLLAKSNVENSKRLRQHQAQMLDLAGIEVPANLKSGDWSKVGLLDEISSAWRQIISTKADREKLADVQKKMFLLLDNGGDRVLSHQEAQALIHGYKLEDWAKENVPSYNAPARTVENIAKEQSDNLLYAKSSAESNAKKIDELNENLAKLQDQKEVSPEEQLLLNEQVKQLTNQRNELQLYQPHLDREVQEAQEWQNPKEEQYKGLLDKMHRALNQAAEESHNSVDAWNEKVRALGNYPQDIAIIEDKFPHLKTYASREYPSQEEPEFTVTPAVEKHAEAGKAEDYEDTKEYKVSLNGEHYATIYRDPKSKNWYDGRGEGRIFLGDNQKQALAKLQKREVENNPEDWRRKFPPSTINGGSTSAFPVAAWQDGPLHPALPQDIVSKVDKTRGKNFSDDHVDYVKKTVKILSDIASRDLTPKEKAMYQSLRDADDQNWKVGYNNGIIKSIVDNHIHHIWGEEEEPVGNSVLQHAASGAFAINATQARHRSWGTAFEGILQGRQLKVHDPAALIAHDANNIARASAARHVLDLLQKSGLKDAEGMPIAAFRGQGSQVPGEDGSSSSILVNPNIVRNILMSITDIDRLKKANLLGAYIKDGRVVDRTPQVNIGNVKDWVKSTQDKIDKLEKKNPLLISAADRLNKRHEAGWGQLQLFAKTQAGKIADYLDQAIQQLKDQGPIDGKNYAPIDLEHKPNDINIAAYLANVLHGEVRKKITPGDLERLEQYALRNHEYAEGRSSRQVTDEDGDKSFSGKDLMPHEIARLIFQEKDHLDPELIDYIEHVNGLTGGDWSLKGINSAIYHIAHAAENTQHPQLIKDLADLKYVDNVLTTQAGGEIPWKETKFKLPINKQTIEQNKLESEEKLRDINERQEKQYLWAPKNHIPVDHPAFHAYKWMATASDGTPTLAQSDMTVSRHYYRYLVNRLGLEPSWLRKREGLGKITAPILKGGAAAKAAILSGSPFHIVQEALRALMLHVNPFVRPNPLEDLDEEYNTVKGPRKLMRLGVENGLTLFSNRFDAEDYAVGVSSHIGEDNVLRKVPILNQYLRVSDQVHDLLFNRLIPSYKASGFRKMFDKYASAHPDWTDDAVAKAAAEHVNNAFGGQNWREMGRSAATQDWFHLVALAPDWLESEMRFAAGLFKGLGIGPAKYEPDSGRNFSREQVAGAAVVLWTTARLLNQLYSGNPHLETPFGLATKDKDGREIEFSVRTLPTDILHMASDPQGFLIGRESPFLRSGIETYTGRNQYGQKLTDGQKYVDLISNLAPIWGQAGLKDVTHLATSADTNTGEQVAKWAGATAQVYRTPAQKTAANLAAERSEEGSMNPAMIQRHRLLLQLEDSLRNGQINNNDIQRMVDEGNLPEADAKAAIKNAKETAGEDPEMARLYSRVTRLDFAGSDQVYRDSNPSEKTILQKLLIKKAKNYIHKSLKDETPLTRSQDPYYKAARRYAPIEDQE